MFGRHNFPCVSSLSSRSTCRVSRYGGLFSICRIHVIWRSIQHKSQLCSLLAFAKLSMQNIGFSMRYFPFIQSLPLLSFQPAQLHKVASSLKRGIFGFPPSKQLGVSEKNAPAGRIIANKHYIHIMAEKMALKKCNTRRSKIKQATDTPLKHSEGKDLSQKPIVMVFDLETTGLSCIKDRIIEFAAQDLVGGRHSTFQSLVNPECFVTNERIHHISNQMVNRSDVPRWKDLAPILVLYVKSRQKAGGPVIWVAHNCRRFDARFLVKEFNRCSLKIPSDWVFVDTLPLARQVMKLNGSTRGNTSLLALREHYRIPLIGEAHRAMSDVHMLALVLQKLSFDLKLPVSGLLEMSFKASDLFQD